MMIDKQPVESLELRTVRSQYRKLCTEGFEIGKGIGAQPERWYLLTPQKDFYGDTIEEVLEKAQRDGISLPSLDRFAECE